MRALVSSALAALLLTVALPAAADGMRCGSKLVTNGDPRAKVRQFCGEPTDVQTRRSCAARTSTSAVGSCSMATATSKCRWKSGPTISALTS